MMLLNQELLLEIIWGSDVYMCVSHVNHPACLCSDCIQTRWLEVYDIGYKKGYSARDKK